jgi:hypothetical protein
VQISQMEVELPSMPASIRGTYQSRLQSSKQGLDRVKKSVVGRIVSPQHQLTNNRKMSGKTLRGLNFSAALAEVTPVSSMTHTRTTLISDRDCLLALRDWRMVRDFSKVADIRDEAP